ncbi:DUF637 domain-containing protein [Moraxella sp. ZY200743]|uniref:two-partner secretion domain-containing protein n=1 Tax=Moraxella sp. ZY200743 TaxID=2911970 RepID=UPI003D7D1225
MPSSAKFFTHSSLYTSILIALSVSNVAVANITTDPKAPTTQKPIIAVAKNTNQQNIPVIQIQTPNHGISHNKYTQFDVSTSGAILNNSRHTTHTQLAGVVNANPFLRQGEAHTIINEVRSNKPSQLSGVIEVAGQKANLVIANPSGINVAGSGFINVHKATLSTGRIQSKQGQITHAITEGVIQIQTPKGVSHTDVGLGGANKNADLVNLYSKTASINAQLQAKHAITIVTGANQISDTGQITPINDDKSVVKTKTPATIAIDVKALGGMSAGSITLIGTDQGFGVNQAGRLNANNHIIITADGKITHTGHSRANQGVELDAKQISIDRGFIDTNGSLLLTAKQKLATDGSTLTASRNIQAVVTGDGTTHQQSSAVFKNTTLTATNITTANLAGILTHQDTTLNATGNISSFAQHDQRLDNTTMTSGQNSQIQTNHDLSISNTSINTKQHMAIYAKGNQTTNNSLLNAKGVFSNITDGRHAISGDVSHTGGAVLLHSDDLVVQDDGQLTTRAIGNTLLADNDSIKRLNGDLSIQTNRTLNISPQHHSIQAVGDLSLRAVAGDLHLQGQGGNLGSGSQQTLRLDATLGGIELQGQNIHLQGSNLHANQDIGLYATQGHIVIDGVKNTLSNQQAAYALDYAKKQLDDTKAKLDALKKQPKYIAYHQEKARLENLNVRYEQAKIPPALLDEPEQTVTLLMPSPPRFVLSSNPHLVAPMMVYDPPERVVMRIPNPNRRSRRSTPVLDPELLDFDPKKAFQQLRQNHKEVIEQEASFTNQQERLASRVSFLTQAVFGYEHSTASLNSKTGDITLAASSDILLSGASLDAKAGDIHLSAQGMMPNAYTKTKSDTTQTLNGSIVLDGLQNYYERGRENSDHHRILAFSTPTKLSAGKNIHLHATHQSPNTHLVIQGGQLQAAQDININANHAVLLDAGLDYEYGYDKNTHRHGKWYKRKYTTTISSNEWKDVAPTTLTAYHIRLKTHGSNRKNNLALYGTKMHTTGGDISLWSSGNIALYAVDSTHSNEYNSHTKKRFLGIRYNDTHKQGKKYLKTALPATLTANYIGSHSQGDTTLEGTQFNYLSGASITANGRLSLLSATSELQERHQKDSNWVLWQRTTDQGQIKESAILPSFTGITKPVLDAKGGIHVQIPTTEQDAQQHTLKAQILQLATEPQYSYLTDLVHREDINWQQIILTQEDWDYKQQGLTPAGAAIVTIALSAATGDFSGSIATAATTAFQSQTIGAMASAAFNTLTTKATISLINNQGNIKATLKELGSKDSVKQLAFALASAGMSHKIDKALKIKNTDITQTTLNQRTIKAIADGTSKSLLESAIYGTSLEESLKNNLRAQLTTVATQEVFKGPVKDLDGDTLSENLSHKLAAALTGCLSAKASGNDCNAGMIGATIAETWADYQVDDPSTLTQTQKNTLIHQAKLLAAITAAYAEEDVNTAASMAEEAVRWNGTYIDKNNEVKKVILNGDKGIYKCNFQNDKCIDPPIKIGESMFEDAFISPDTGNAVGRIYIGENIDEYIYDLNSQAWLSGFYGKELYAYNSLPGNKYDIKSNYPGHKGKSYHAFLFTGKYITLREGGNILAGMNAAILGVPFDEFQKASGALHAGGKLGLIRHKTTGYVYGAYPRYGEIDYQYLRSKYGYQLGIKRIECNINNSNSLGCENK